VVVVPSNFLRRVKRLRRDVKVVPFGLWLEQYLQYRGLGRVFDMGIVSPLVLYKGILDVLEAFRLVRRRLRVAVVGVVACVMLCLLITQCRLFSGFLRRRSGVYWRRACIIFTYYCREV
jgi:glycosyltransferase involved in cell wall biosynthesis